jgi:hypothetical protein
MPTQLPTFIHVASKAAFVHVTDVIFDNSNITAAFKENGIQDISSILRLTDVTVENLTYHDPDPNVTTTYCLKKGEIGLIKAFIHFVHYLVRIQAIISGSISPRMNLTNFVVISSTRDDLELWQISSL